MRTVPVDDFLPALRQIGPAAMPITLKQALVYSAGRFCRMSGVVHVDCVFERVKHGETIDVIEQSSVAIHSDMSLKSTGDVEATEKGVLMASGSDYECPAVGAVRFLRNADNVHLCSAVEPASQSKQLPASLYDNWMMAVCEGAASWLYGLPEFINGDLHSYHEREFVEHVRRAKRWQLDNKPASTRPVRRREFF